MKYRPYIVQDVNGQNQCEEDDPLGPCYDRRITIVNPLKLTVFVKLDCGIEFLTKAESYIPGKGVVTIAINTAGFVGGLRKGECKIKLWKEWGGNRKTHYLK